MHRSVPNTNQMIPSSLVVAGLIALAGGGGLALSGAARDRASGAKSASGSATSKKARAAEKKADSVRVRPRRDVYTMLERYAGIDPVPLPATPGDETATVPNGCWRTRQARERIAAFGYTNVHVLVATVPDPQDSRFIKLFDDAVAAMRMALERSGFVDDRFSDPWQRDAGEGPHATRPPHRERPGMLLFRRANTQHQELLVLLLVGETPTWGVHRRALWAALDLASAILAPLSADARDPSQAPAPGTVPTLPILAPTMSGTSESLRINIAQWFESQHEYGKDKGGPFCHAKGVLPFQVSFLSGSATSKENQQKLATGLTETVRKSFPTFTSSFQATVHSDSAQQPFVFNYLANHLKLCRIARLIETSTSYGEDAASYSVALDCPACTKGKVRVFDLPFPLHISKLRSTAEQNASDPAPAGPLTIKRLQALERDEDIEVEEDAFPAKSRITQSVSEISLEQTLRAIESEDVQAVVILATSTSDVMFLVKKVRESFPNVVVVANDADLVYLHDDVPFMEGTLVASTYPLLPWAQRLTFPYEGDRTRLLFPSSSAQGIYNATLLLLGGLTSQDVLDYSYPFDVARDVPRARIGPGQWMTMVSRGAFWPLAAEPGDEDPYLRRLAPRTSPAVPDTARPRMVGAAWTFPRSFVFRLVAVVVVVLDLLLIVAYVGGQSAPRLPDGRSAWRAMGLFLRPSGWFPHPIAQRLEVAALLLVATIVTVLFFGVGLVTVLPASVDVPEPLRTTTGGFGILAFGMLALTVHAFLRVRNLPQRCAVQLALLGAAAVSVGLTLASFSRLAVVQKGTGAENIISFLFFVERARNLDSGISLLWIAVLLALGHALWILGHLRQGRIIEDAHALRRYGVIPCHSEHPPTAPVSLLDSMKLTEPIKAAVRHAEEVLPNRFEWLLMAVVFGEALWISRRLIFFEAWGWGAACAAAYALLLSVVIYGCVRYLRTWRALEEVLARVAPLPVTAAIARIPVKLLTSFKRPWDDYVFAVWQRHCQTVFAGLRDDEKRFPQLAAQLGVAANDLPALLAAPVAMQIEGTDSPNPARPLDQKTLNRAWQEFQAMRLVALIQYIRSHLQNFVAVTTAALLPALWATNFYPLRENRFLLILVLVVAGAAVSVTSLVFVQMNRNYVLSKLDNNNNPGHVTWDRTFVMGLLFHVALPILALLAVKFPELGRGWGALAAALSATGGG